MLRYVAWHRGIYLSLAVCVHLLLSEILQLSLSKIGNGPEILRNFLGTASQTTTREYIMLPCSQQKVSNTQFMSVHQSLQKGMMYERIFIEMVDKSLMSYHR
ncbi:hypothetical protein O6H91_21G053000 [Diphasiastrum complanatum]|uniref:Uncharacterized protein n=1 Tax=Diphasiastrum complanatum TaxID=34168 RepID=A0ACC2AMC7_DIPCM|nr:hypothetical protein O6H91_21G053000 [Diphasiastrum complanatum]